MIWVNTHQMKTQVCMLYVRNIPEAKKIILTFSKSNTGLSKGKDSRECSTLKCVIC